MLSPLYLAAKCVFWESWEQPLFLLSSPAGRVVRHWLSRAKVWVSAADWCRSFSFWQSSAHVLWPFWVKIHSSYFKNWIAIGKSTIFYHFYLSYVPVHKNTLEIVICIFKWILSHVTKNTCEIVYLKKIDLAEMSRADVERPYFGHHWNYTSQLTRN